MNLNEGDLDGYLIDPTVTEPESEFAKLYKSCGFSYAEKQAKRRQNLLDKQKQQRAKNVDNVRCYEEIVASLAKPKNRRPRIYNDYVQLSEWLREKPDDWHNWLMVPCPKGMRCIVVATDGCTKVYNKKGFFTKHFRSTLPGSMKNKHTTTILDCIYTKDDGIFYALDVIAYANQDMINCDASFRFFWLQNKIKEEHFDGINAQNENVIQALQYVDCSDARAMDECLSRYPMWFGNCPQLDGLLFYHKESSYIHGSTPLVGWLFPFMVPEVLGDFITLNPEYLNEMPDTYVDCQSYTDEFDEKIKTKKSKRDVREKCDEMDGIANESNGKNVCEEAAFLECEELRSDDIYYDAMD